MTRDPSAPIEGGLDIRDPGRTLYGPIATAVVREFPGRLKSDDAPPAPDKPSEGETPWRSRDYVTHRHSADGNSYRPGDPIPPAEAMRQGLTIDGSHAVDVAQVAREAAIGERTTANRLATENVVANQRRVKEDHELAPFDLPFDACIRCGGSGKRANMPTHKEGCGCPACSPCKLCGGTGKHTVEEETDGDGT